MKNPVRRICPQCKIIRNSSRCGYAIRSLQHTCYTASDIRHKIERARTDETRLKWNQLLKLLKAN